MESVYIVLTATGTLFSRCIGFYTKARYNHVSLCIDSEISEFYSFGRKIRWFPLIGGFVVEHADKGLFKAFGDTMCDIYRIDISNAQYNMLKKEIDVFIRDRRKYGYNILGLIAVMINKPLSRKYKYFCTQFVASMLQKCRIHDFRKDPSLVTPIDFYDIKNLVPVYEGRLCDLGSDRDTIIQTAEII